MITIYDETRKGWEVKPIKDKSLYSFAKVVKVKGQDKEKIRRLSILANGDFEPLVTESEIFRNNDSKYMNVDIDLNHYFCHKDFSTILTTKAQKPENIFCLTFDVRENIVIGIESVGEVQGCEILEYLVFGGEFTVIARLNNPKNESLEVFLMNRKTGKFHSVIVHSNGSGYEKIENSEKAYPHLFANVGEVNPITIQRVRPKNLATHTILCTEDYTEILNNTINKSQKHEIVSVVNDDKIADVIGTLRANKISAVTVFIPSIGEDEKWESRAKEIYDECLHKFKVVLIYEYDEATGKGILIPSKL